MSSKYLEIKHSMALSALVQAQSLPRELVRGRAGVAIPSPFPVREESKSDELELDALFDANNNGYCECWPDLNVPLLQTGPVPPDTTAPLILRGVFSVDQPLAETLVGIAPSHTSVLRDFGPNIGQAIRFNQVVNVAPAFANAHVRLDLEPYEYPLTVFVEVWNGAAWVVWLQTVSPFIHLDFTDSAVPVVGATFIRVRIAVPAIQFLERRKLSVNICLFNQVQQGLVSTAWGFYTPGAINWDVMAASQWPYLTQLPDIDRVRNLGYECLATYTGSRQLDGGKIAAALVPFDWSPTATNPFDAVSAVRHNKYSSALRDGAHGTWRIGSLDEMNPSAPQERPFPAFKLVFGYQRNSVENQSLRLRATGLFGVYSDSPILGLAPFVPSLMPQDLELLMDYFATAPAVTENSLHLRLKSAANFLKKVAPHVVNLGKKAIGVAMDNPEVLSALAIAAGQPEIAAGIESYSMARKGKTAAVTKTSENTKPKKKKKKQQ